MLERVVLAVSHAKRLRYLAECFQWCFVLYDLYIQYIIPQKAYICNENRKYRVYRGVCIYVYEEAISICFY